MSSVSPGDGGAEMGPKAQEGRGCRERELGVGRGSGAISFWEV